VYSSGMSNDCVVASFDVDGKEGVSKVGSFDSFRLIARHIQLGELDHGQF